MIFKFQKVDFYFVDVVSILLGRRVNYDTKHWWLYYLLILTGGGCESVGS